MIGYFTGSNSASSSEGLFVPFTPDRLVDTRDLSGALPVGTVMTGLTNGNVSVFTSAGGHFLLDAAGYFTSGTT